jgi:hypothetical protein
MGELSFDRLAATPNRSPAETYVAVLLALLAVIAFELVLPTVLLAFAGGSPAFGRLFGLVGYALLVVAALGLGSWTWQSHSDPGAMASPGDRFSNGVVAFILVAGGLLVMSDGAGVTVPASDLVVTVHVAVWTVVVGATLASVLGVDIGVGLPDEAHQQWLVGAMAMPAALVVLLYLTLPSGGEVPAGFAFGPTNPSPSAGELVRSVVVPAVTGVAGSAVLYFGATQSGLRSVTTSGHAIVAVTTLLVAFRTVVTVVGSVLSFVTPVTPSLFLPVAVVAGGLVAHLAGVAWQRLSETVPERAASDAGAAAFGVVAGIAAIVGLGVLVGAFSGQLGVLSVQSTRFVVNVVGYALVAALAALGYERTGSIWVPVLALLPIQLFVSWFRLTHMGPTWLV